MKKVTKQIIGYSVALLMCFGPYAYLGLANKYNWNSSSRGASLKEEIKIEKDYEIPKIPARYIPKNLYSDTTNLSKIEKNLLK